VRFWTKLYLSQQNFVYLHTIEWFQIKPIQFLLNRFDLDCIFLLKTSNQSKPMKIDCSGCFFFKIWSNSNTYSRKNWITEYHWKKHVVVNCSFFFLKDSNIHCSFWYLGEYMPFVVANNTLKFRQREDPSSFYVLNIGQLVLVLCNVAVNDTSLNPIIVVYNSSKCC